MKTLKVSSELDYEKIINDYAKKVFKWKGYKTTNLSFGEKLALSAEILKIAQPYLDSCKT